MLNNPLFLSPFTLPYTFTVSVDFTQAAWNTVGAHRVLTCTGIVIVNTVAAIDTTLTGGGGATISYGTTTSPAGIMSAQALANHTAGKIWRTTATAPNPDTALNQFSYASNGFYGLATYTSNQGFTIAVSALTGGTMTFYIQWVPLSAGATVVAASGGAL